MSKSKIVDAAVTDEGKRWVDLMARAATQVPHRTNAEKEAAVLSLLMDPDLAGRSAGWYAAKCDVSKPFVRKVQNNHGIEVPCMAVGIDGKTYPTTMSRQGNQ